MYEDEERVPGSGADERGEGQGAPLAGVDERGLAERGDEGERGGAVGRRRRPRARRTVSPEEAARGKTITPEQRLVLLDVWQRSDLPASDFSELAGVSPHSLYTWKKKFDAEGPAGLVGLKRGAPKGSRQSVVARIARRMRAMCAWWISWRPWQPQPAWPSPARRGSRWRGPSPSCRSRRSAGAGCPNPEPGNDPPGPVRHSAR